MTDCRRAPGSAPGSALVEGAGVGVAGGVSSSASQALKASRLSTTTSNSICVVQEAAELGALAAVGPLAVGEELDHLVLARRDVALVQEGRHVERVDDVDGVHLQLDGLADRDVHLRRRPVRPVAVGRRDADDRDALALVLGGAAVLPADVRRRVDELPLPLVGDDADPDGRVLLAGVDRVEGLPRDDEEGEDDGDGDRRPDDLELVVAVDLRRQLVVALAAAVAEDGEEDQALDEEEDRGADEEDDVVEVPDRLALGRRGVGREGGADVEVRSSPSRRGRPRPAAARAPRGGCGLFRVNVIEPPSTVHAAVLRPRGRPSPAAPRRDAADGSARMIPEPRAEMRMCDVGLPQARNEPRRPETRENGARDRRRRSRRPLAPRRRSLGVRRGVAVAALLGGRRRPWPTAARCRRRPDLATFLARLVVPPPGRAPARSSRPSPTCGPSAASTRPTRRTPCPRDRPVFFLVGLACIASPSSPGSSATTPSSSPSTWSSTSCSSSARPRPSSSPPRSRSSCASRRRTSATGWILPVLRSRVVKVIGHPLVAWLLFTVVMWGSHVSPLFDAALEDPLVHDLEHGLYLASAHALLVAGRRPRPEPVAPAVPGPDRLPVPPDAPQLAPRRRDPLLRAGPLPALHDDRAAVAADAARGPAAGGRDHVGRRRRRLPASRSSS